MSRIVAAQEKEALQRQGDELHAKIQKAEMEIDGLENTLRLINGGNDQLRRSLKKVGGLLFKKFFMTI